MVRNEVDGIVEVMVGGGFGGNGLENGGVGGEVFDVAVVG